jgi:hypothetical protein
VSKHNDVVSIETSLDSAKEENRLGQAYVLLINLVRKRTSAEQQQQQATREPAN